MRRWPVVAVLAAGVLLRLLALAASGPVSLYLNDSADYLNRSRHLVPDGYHPLGYPVFLLLVRGAQHPLLLAWVQHGLGIATGVLVIVAGRRLGLPAWGAALAAAPVLLDPYQVIAEQTVVAESLCGLLVTAAVVLVAVRRPDRARGWLALGILLAAAVLVRTAALAAVVVLIAALLPAGLRRDRARLAALVLGLVLPLGAYAGWFASRHGTPGLSERGGIYLYGRLAPVATCPPALHGTDRSLCDPRPVAQRPQPDWYLWQPGNPAKRLSADTAVRSAAMTRAGRAMLAHDPAAWLTSTAGYLWRDVTFGPWRTAAGRTESTLVTWRADPRLSTRPAAADVRLSDGFRTVAHTTPWATTALRGYQRVAGTPWPLVAVLLAAGLARCRDPRSRPFLVCAAAGTALLVLPAATVGWDVRFLLPALGPLGLAAALAVPLVRRVP